MTFIGTIAPAESRGEVLEMYQRQQSGWGFVPNYAKVFCHRPELMTAWAELQRTLRKTIDEESYELVTLAAARALGSSYCTLAHGKKLVQKGYTVGQLSGPGAESTTPALSRAQQAMMDVARTVATDSTSLVQSDFDELRSCGFDDGEIFDIVAAAAARCFFAKLVDALGTLPDSTFHDLSDDLKSALVVGRSISEEPVIKLEQ